LTKNDTLVQELTSDYETASITDGEKAMLRYVERLTRVPGRIKRTDVTALREVGFSDGAILDICQVAAYYAFVNRIADGLGVELESDTGAG